MSWETLKKLTRRPALLAAGVGMMTTMTGAGCGGDDDSEFQLVLLAEQTTLTAGADQTTVRVSVLDGAFNPPPQGSNVTLITAAGGNVNGTGQTAGTSPTDALGFAEFSVACTATETLTVLARYEGTTGVLRSGIECQPAPAGDWTLTIAAEPRRIGTETAATVSVTAVDGDGRPVPADTGLQIEITSGDLQFTRGGTTLTREADGNGSTQATVRSGLVEGTATVCASFADARFGNTPSCVAIVVSNRELTDASCIATVSSPTSPADGQTVTTVSYTVADASGSPIGGSSIVMEAAAGAWVDAGINGNVIGAAQTLTSDGNGDAVAFLRSPSEGGSADISATATIVEDGVERQLACEFSDNLVFFGAPACRFDGMDPGIIGVTNSGIEETGTVTFCFESSRGRPVLPNTRVEFEFDLAVVGLRANAQSALTDIEGCASVEVTAGQQAGLFEMRATVPFGDSESTCTSGPLPIRHGRPSATGWNLLCEQRATSALLNTIGDEVFSDCTLNCQGYLRDRFGNPVNSPDVQVYFAAEQGTIASPVTPDENGRFVTRYNPNGTVPRDVEPLAGEISAFDPDGNRVNPRDMFVTIVAWTNGEEGFDDENGDGYYNDGEVFIDLPEPFIDHDDNDEYNPEFPVSDRFIDVESDVREFNGIWDNTNQSWDSSTVIWIRSGVTLVGTPIFASFDSVGYVQDLSPGVPDRDYFSALYDRGTNPIYTGEQDGIGFPSDGNLRAEYVDAFFNSPGPSDTISYELAACDAYELADPSALEGTTAFGSLLMSRSLVDLGAGGVPAVGADVVSREWRTTIAAGITSFPLNFTEIPNGGTEDCSFLLSFNMKPTEACTQELETTYNIIFEP
jgi:hypothetical protein